VLERGFLHAARLRLTGQGAQSPALRALASLSLTPGRSADASELGSPGLRDLRTLRDLDVRHLDTFASSARSALRQLGLLGLELDTPKGQQSQRRILGHAATWPALQVLSLQVNTQRTQAGWFDWLFEAALTQQLTRLRLGVPLPFDVVGAQTRLERNGLTRLQLELAAPGLSAHLTHGELTLAFDGPGALTRYASAMRNLAARFLPSPWDRLRVRVGDRAASLTELEGLGPLITAHAVS
jgi:hypothetical protein